jgi:O-antigen/teichoic acid export membrane protein
MSDEPENLANRTATGMVWLASQTVFARILSLLSQLVLAWLLMPEHFGLWGLVITITGFGTLLNNPGIDDVLLQKQKHLKRWITPAFWLSLACSVGGSILMALIGTIIVLLAHHRGNSSYGNFTVLWMILILCIGSPLNALGTVPVVMLRSQMRFFRLAGVNCGEVLLQQSLIVLCAAMKLGPYSFVLPMPFVALIRAIVLWGMVRPPIQRHLAIHRWPALISSTSWVFGYRLFATLTNQGDYMTLGFMNISAAIIGQYFFAFMVATQVIRVLCDNLASVLMPALNTMYDNPVRMEQAVHRSSRALAAMVIPVVTLQIVLAGPAIRLVFPPKWEPAIVLVQLLSFGPLLYAAAWPMGVMMLAAGRFRTLFFLWLLNAISFFVMVGIGTHYFQAAGTAAAVSLWSWFSAFLHSVFAMQSLRGCALLLRNSWRPLLAAAVSAAVGAIPAWLILLLMHTGRLEALAQLLIVTPVIAGVYFVLMRKLDPESIQVLIDRFSSVLGVLARKLGKAPTPGFEVV